MIAIHMPDVRWYVVHTKPQQEMRAESNLRAWGIETLAPTLRHSELSRSCGSGARVRLLFPRYLFARFDAALLLAKVRLTRGIQNIVGFGAGATPVDDAVISLIRSRIADDGFVRVTEPRPGDTVEIVDGPLRSLVGVFEREANASNRVLILLTSIGCPMRVRVAKASLRPTERRQIA